MSFLKVIYGELKSGKVGRLAYFVFPLIYMGCTVSTFNYFTKTVFMPPRGSVVVISTMLFLTYFLFVVTTKRLRHLGFKKPILMSAFLSWTGFMTLLAVFLHNRFILDHVPDHVIGQSASIVLGAWLALMILFIPPLIFGRENLFKLNFLKLFNC